MTRDEIAQTMQDTAGYEWGTESHFQRFATLLKKRMIRDGWRQCAVGQRTTQFCGQLEAAVEAEREACAKKAERWDAFHPDSNYGHCIAKLIRERDET